MRVMALDISKGKSYVVVYNQEICTDEFEVYHNQEGFNKLRNVLNKHETTVVFEATGVYSRVIERFLNTENISYCKLNPLLAKMQTQTLRSNKTDIVDAHKLAQSHYNFTRELTVAQDTLYIELKDVSSLYDEIKRTLIKERNQLHAVIQKTFPELESLFSNYLSHFALNIIKEYPHPDLISESSRTKIKNRVLLFTKKRLSQEQAKKKANKLISMAKLSYPSVDKNDFAVTEVQIRIDRIKNLLDTKETLAQKMIDLSLDLPEFGILTSIPGIGDLSAALIISEVGDIRRFTTSNKMNAYMGIDIRSYQSGTLQKKDRINKRGNAKARMIFYFIVRNMLRVQKTSPNHIVDYYYKMKKQPFNKHDKVAMVACMNKLVKVIHFLVNTENFYDYTKSPRS